MTTEVKELWHKLFFRVFSKKTGSETRQKLWGNSLRNKPFTVSENKLPHIYSTCDPKVWIAKLHWNFHLYTESKEDIWELNSLSKLTLKLMPNVYSDQIKLITFFRLGAAFGMKTNSGTIAPVRLFWIAREQYILIRKYTFWTFVWPANMHLSQWVVQNTGINCNNVLFFNFFTCNQSRIHDTCSD